MNVFAANVLGWVILVSLLNFLRDYAMIGICMCAARNLFRRYVTHV